MIDEDDLLDAKDIDNMLGNLSLKELQYMLARFNTSSIAEARKKIGVGEACSTKLEKKVSEPLKIIMQDVIKSAALKMQNALLSAVDVKISGLESESEVTRQAVSSELIDRVMGKPVARSEISGKGGNAISIDAFSGALKKVYGTNDDEVEEINE